MRIKSGFSAISNKGIIPYDVTFLAQSGHLVTLKKPDEIDEEQKVWKWENLPFYPEEHGGWQYKVIQEKKVGHFPTPQERYEEIKDELKSGDYDFVIHAGDPDQEGEQPIQLFRIDKVEDMFKGAPASHNLRGKEKIETTLHAHTYRGQAEDAVYR